MRILGDSPPSHPILLPLLHRPSLSPLALYLRPSLRYCLCAEFRKQIYQRECSLVRGVWRFLSRPATLLCLCTSCCCTSCYPLLWFCCPPCCCCCCYCPFSCYCCPPFIHLCMKLCCVCECLFVQACIQMCLCFVCGTGHARWKKKAVQRD